MASVDENWVITLDPQDVISLSHGMSIDAWPDQDDGDAITIDAKAPCDLDNADFMAWLENQNWNNVTMAEFLKSWFEAISRVRNGGLLSDVSAMRKAELLSALYDELGQVMHQMGMLKDDDVFEVQP